MAEAERLYISGQGLGSVHAARPRVKRESKEKINAEVVCRLFEARPEVGDVTCMPRIKWKIRQLFCFDKPGVYSFSSTV